TADSWRKSSYSGANGGECVESPPRPTPCWCETARTGPPAC
ncbi:MAG TPA: DUF397 domain-containing protein, partial [Streptosporangiaceae bacterium]|nr:DUF397 domain-containing protein [Streptosporangiaceae bacterium]